ncbi:YolD-like family protein [Paenibacillus sp. WLX2291]|uniref:YolD-like family protein n=1 Tax=Paenibacillus sp. WLX2291 TaxID=3296934 RepID=UPI00398446D8
MTYQDRGNKKWTSMFLSEHRDRLHEWALSQKDVERPILSADQLEELNYVIERYLLDHSSVIISYYKNGKIVN